MKPMMSARSFLRCVSAAAFLLLPALSSTAATLVVGSGPDASFLVLESSQLGVRTYEIRYDATSGPKDGKFLFDQALAADATLVATFFNFGTVAEPNFFINAINGEAGSTSPPWTWWAHWVAGGNGWQNPDFSFNPGPAAEGVWSVGNGMSAPWRTLSNGSWDGYVLSDGSSAPSVSPIPEPASALLLAPAALCLLRRRRNSQRALS